MRPSSANNLTRRDFVSGSAATLGAIGLLSNAHAAGDDEIKIALVGCGGRGTGAAQDKVLMENIRVLTPIPNPFSPGTFTTSEAVYNVVFRFDPTTLHLIPETVTPTGSSGGGSTGGGSTTTGCANAEVQVYNSVRGAASPLVGAAACVIRSGAEAPG